MIATIGKVYRFEAAHDLPYHDGKCKGLHGHSYQVEIAVTDEVQEIAETNPESGMVVDFQELDGFMKRLLAEKLDHKYLNDSLGIYTTAENIARWIASVVRANGFTTFSVKLWETANCWALVEYVDGVPR
jgi:6-pyruvoyltetrahydropterin/6-carboxytetrahydropterin synthase